jgi:hypothetical protein
MLNSWDGTIPSALPNGMSLLFIGDYGKHVLTIFKRLEAMEPVLNPCDHVPKRDALRMRVVAEVEDVLYGQNLIQIISSGTVIVIFDDRLPDDHALAEILCRWHKKVRRSGLTIGMSPFVFNPLANQLFDLFLNTWQRYSDSTPCVLLTLYKTYCGCSRLGNLLCLVVQLQDILHAGCSGGILLAQKTIGHFEQIVSFNDLYNVAAHIRAQSDSAPVCLVWYIVEMHHAEAEPLKVMEDIGDNILIDNVDRLILPHASLLKKEYRVTVFGLS